CAGCTSTSATTWRPASDAEPPDQCRVGSGAAWSQAPRVGSGEQHELDGGRSEDQQEQHGQEDGGALPHRLAPSVTEVTVPVGWSVASGSARTRRTSSPVAMPSSSAADPRLTASDSNPYESTTRPTSPTPISA